MHPTFFAYSTRLTVILTVALTLAACATTPAEPITLRDKELYDMGRAAVAANDFSSAVDSFEILSARRDSSGYATHAQLDLAHAYYKLGQHERALESVDRYVTDAPKRDMLDYAYYLKGLIYLDQATLLAQQSDADLNAAITVARQSYLVFSDLVQNFPASKYGASANRRLTQLRENLADFEVRVARGFLVQGKYTTAAEHARYVLENYPDTPAMADAVRLLRDISESSGNNRLLPALPPETRPLPAPPATMH